LIEADHFEASPVSFRRGAARGQVTASKIAKSRRRVRDGSGSSISSAVARSLVIGLGSNQRRDKRMPGDKEHSGEAGEASQLCDALDRIDTGRPRAERQRRASARGGAGVNRLTGRRRGTNWGVREISCPRRVLAGAAGFFHAELSAW
jgi:hypothetical protein